MVGWSKFIINVAVGILRKENKILITKRPEGKPYSGYWEFPGGKIESHESGVDALKRELREELGIHVLHAEFWFQHSHTYPDKKVLLEMWQVFTYKGKPQSKEKQELRWVTLQELFAFQILEGNLAILKYISSGKPLDKAMGDAQGGVAQLSPLGRPRGFIPRGRSKLISFVFL